MSRKRDLLSSKPFIALLVSSFVLLLSLLPSYEVMERRLLDLSFVIRGAEKPHPDIIIIEINDESLKRIGSWPWPRSYHAALLKILREQKPAAIFFDVIFSETSSPEEDLVLAHEIEQAGNVVLPFYFPATDRKHILMRPEGLPIPQFRDKAHTLGYVNAFPDPDGHVRELPLTLSDDKERYKNASLALSSIHLGLKTDEDFARFDRGPTLINFPGPYEVFSIIPFEYLIAIRDEPWAKGLLDSLKDKVILVGHTATGTALDLKPSPYSPQYPGVALQASTVHTVLSGKYIERVPRWLVFLFLFGFALSIIYITVKLSPLKGLLYSLACVLITFQVAILGFQHFQIWFPYLGFLILGPTLYILTTLIQFLKVQMEREILNRELTLASSIQKNLLPAEMPKIPNVEVAALSIPAKHVGGDLYDMIQLPENKWGICVGDVSGKGVPAALFMAKAISEFRREADASSTADVISRLNDKLSNEGVGGLFLTLIYILLDPKTGQFSFSNGGHEPILHYQKKNNKVELLMTDEGLPLGIAAGSDFDSKTQMWETGDVLILQSDGVKEAMNLDREIFGFERAQKALLESASENTEGIIKHLHKRILEFVGEAPQHDDTTIVCIKHL